MTNREKIDRLIRENKKLTLQLEKKTRLNEKITVHDLKFNLPKKLRDILFGTFGVSQVNDPAVTTHRRHGDMTHVLRLARETIAAYLDPVVVILAGQTQTYNPTPIFSFFRLFPDGDVEIFYQNFDKNVWKRTQAKAKLHDLEFETAYIFVPDRAIQRKREKRSYLQTKNADPLQAHHDDRDYRRQLTLIKRDRASRN